MKKCFILLLLLIPLLATSCNKIKVKKNEILVERGVDTVEFGRSSNITQVVYIVKSKRTGKIKGKLVVNTNKEKFYSIKRDRYTIIGKRPLTEEEKRDKEQEKKEMEKYNKFFSIKPSKER